MKSRQAQAVVLGMGLLLLTSVAAHADWVPLDSTERTAPTISVLDPVPDQVVLQVQMPGFEIQTVTIEGSAHSKILLPGQAPLLMKGLPELPAISRSIIIADRGTPALRVLEVRYRDFPVDPIVPSKGNLPRTIDPATVPYEFAPMYADGGTFPALEAEISAPYILRDHRGVTVRIYPFRYDAGRGVMQVLESMTLEVATTGTGGVNVKERSGQTTSDAQFQRIYQSMFLNLPANRYAPIGTQGPMLVVCYDAFVGAAAPFVAWKQQKGIPTDLITTSSVGGTASGIYDEIYARYHSPEGLTYVVLVGDIAQVPTIPGSWEGADSDPMYAKVDGDDHYLDLFVSRISAQNPSQVEQQVAKFIRYERDPDLGGDWYHMGTGIASNESGGTGYTDFERTDWLRDDLLGYTFTDVDQIYQGAGGSTAGITSALNAGRSIVNYIGHGSGNAWTSVYFGVSDVHALANGWMQPWILDVSCSNGDFSQSECFAEAWLRAGTVSQPTGAIATYSASTLAAWVPPTVMQAEAVDLLVADVENTIGALYFSGSLKTLDTYPPPSNDGVEVLEQYNIFGDCSLVVRTDTPMLLAASHQPVFAIGSPTFSVDLAGVAGATVCLYRDGVIHGTAVSDETGMAEIVLTEPILTPGDVTLTVTAYNHAPYITILPAIVPAQVSIVPASIPVGVATPVSVTVLDTISAGMGDVTVWIEGYGVSGLEGLTDTAGEVTILAEPRFGEVLKIRGREAGAGYDLFNLELPVTGAVDLTGAAITAEVAAIGLSDALTPFIEGTVSGSALETDLELFITGCGVDLASGDPGNEVTLAVTPTCTGSVLATLAKDGCNVFSSEIPVVPAFGSWSGTIYELADGTTPIAAARVRAFEAGADPGTATPLFDLISAADGSYSMAEELPVAYYDLYVSKFGYLSAAQEVFLMYGANAHDVGLEPAPAGDMTGTVTSSDGGAPVQASVVIYRSDTMETYIETQTNPADGVYSASLPYFEYFVVVRAYQFIPVNINVAIDQPVVVKDFVLDPTVGNVLVIDDGGGRDGFQPPKLAKDGVVIAEGYPIPPSRAASDLMNDLQILGYSAVLEDVGVTNPDMWYNYDLLIVACGANTSAVSSESFRNSLESFVLNEGHLLVEGGEVGYDALSYPGYPSFAENVLHCTSWHHDSSGDVTVAEPEHFVMSVPNQIAGPISMTYSGYGDQDALTAAADAVMVGAWTTYPTNASIVTYDPNPAPQAGQIVYFAFNYAAMDATVRASLLQNAVTYLITPEFGDASASGAITLLGEVDHSGITVELSPAGMSMVTDASGAFSFEGLWAGSYTLTASKDGWTSASAEFNLSTGDQLVGLTLQLAEVVSQEFCNTPGLAIPDNDPEGVSDFVAMPLAAPIMSLDVFLDITHTFIGDLTITLTSPEGTTIRLHHHTGSSTHDIYGWYPDDLTPYESLDSFLDENAEGLWELNVADTGAMDVGTLNAWCLRISYQETPSAAGDREDLPKILALDGNYPNPFNPKTKIVFSVPRAMAVDLAVYDLLGRRVATLVAEETPAGRHEIFWLGQDDQGRQVSSGMYFYRLQADGRTLTNKMMLLK